MPRKAPASPPLRRESVADAIDALEARRKRKPSAWVRAAPKPRSDDLDLDSIR